MLEKIAETIGVLQNPSLEDGAKNGSKQTLFVIKIGGNIIDDDDKLKAFLKEFASLTLHQGMGVKKILVHGGGKLATRLAGQLGIEQKLIDGRRVTDAETLKIVTMVYAGYINKNIVAQLQANNCNAIGISGADGNSILAHKRINTAIEYGFAGDIDTVNSNFYKNLLDQELTIIVAPITHDKKGQILNTNADTIAQELAKALSGDYDVQLIYSFEKNGVLSNINDDTSVVSNINPDSYEELKSRQKITAGMIPKLDNAFAALSHGVKNVIIGNAEELHELINGTKGTRIINE